MSYTVHVTTNKYKEGDSYYVIQFYYNVKIILNILHFLLRKGTDNANTFLFKTYLI